MKLQYLNLNLDDVINFSYLVTGDSFTTIASSYEVGISTVANIMPDVAKAKLPELPGEKKKVARTHVAPTSCQRILEIACALISFLSPICGE